MEGMGQGLFVCLYKSQNDEGESHINEGEKNVENVNIHRQEVKGVSFQDGSSVPTKGDKGVKGENVSIAVKI